MGNGSSEGNQGERAIFTVRGEEYVPWQIALGLFRDALVVMRDAGKGEATPEQMGALIRAMQVHGMTPKGGILNPAGVPNVVTRETKRFPKAESVNGQPAVRLEHLGEFFASSPLPFLWESLPDVWRDAFLARDIFPLNARAKGVETTPKTMKERHLRHDRLKSRVKELGLLGSDSSGNSQVQGSESLTDEQREAVLRYLTTAPEIPRIVRRFHAGFGAPPEEKLPPNWGPDDLVQWICKNTDHNIGKGYLTAEGYQRARELYEPEDPMTAFFRTAPRLHTGGGALVGRGIYPLSLKELLQVSPDTTDWPILTERQKVVCEDCIRAKALPPEMSYMDPNPHYQWTRYQVHTGALPLDFDTAALVRRVLEAGRGRVELTPEALDWAREAGLRASSFPDPSTVAVTAGMGASRPPDAPSAVLKKTQGHLAADVGASSWQELEFRVLESGLDFRKAGTNSRFVRQTWGALRLKGRRVVCKLLIDVSMHRGTLPKTRDADKRRGRVNILNKALRAAFGLSDNPFHNDRRLGTQTIIGAISWGGKS